MFEQIVVGLDGSDTATAALDDAIAVAQKFGSALTLVSVVTIPALTAAAPAGIEEYMKSQIESAQKILEESAEPVRTGGVAAVQTEIRTGGIAGSIMEIAEKVGARLIVVGSRGLSLGGRILLGSTSTSLAHGTPCALLIVPPASSSKGHSSSRRK